MIHFIGGPCLRPNSGLALISMQAKLNRSYNYILLLLSQVGGTLDTSSLKTNFTSEKPAEYYAELYRENSLIGAHVVMLGPGCEEAAVAAINAWPGMAVFSNVNSRWTTNSWRDQSFK